MNGVEMIAATVEKVLDSKAEHEGVEVAVYVVAQDGTRLRMVRRITTTTTAMGTLAVKDDMETETSGAADFEKIDRAIVDNTTMVERVVFTRPRLVDPFGIATGDRGYQVDACDDHIPRGIGRSTESFAAAWSFMLDELDKDIPF